MLEATLLMRCDLLPVVKLSVGELRAALLSFFGHVDLSTVLGRLQPPILESMVPYINIPEIAVKLPPEIQLSLLQCSVPTISLPQVAELNGCFPQSLLDQISIPGWVELTVQSPDFAIQWCKEVELPSFLGAIPDVRLVELLRVLSIEELSLALHYPTPGVVLNCLAVSVPRLQLPAIRSCYKAILNWLKGPAKVLISYLQLTGIVPALIAIEWPQAFSSFFL